MPLYLVPSDDGRPIVVDKTVLFFGRHPECDIVLTKSRKVSRKHCCLAQVDQRFVLRDLGSMNGVKVNGEIVQQSAPVEIGDEIVIGDVGFVLQSDGRRRTADREARAGEMDVPPALRTVPAPDELSQEFPVAIPEEAGSFVDEDTRDRSERGNGRSGREPGRPSRVAAEDSDDVYPVESLPPDSDDDVRLLREEDEEEFDDDGSAPDL